jgi:hypothetical protein
VTRDDERGVDTSNVAPSDQNCLARQRFTSREAVLAIREGLLVRANKIIRSGQDRVLGLILQLRLIDLETLPNRCDNYYMEETYNHIVSQPNITPTLQAATQKPQIAVFQLARYFQV